MTKSIIFDLDNTLYDEKKYFLAVINQFIKENYPEKMNQTITIPNSFRKSNDVFKDILEQIGLYSQKNQFKCFELYKNTSINLQPYKGFDKLIDFKKKLDLN